MNISEIKVIIDELPRILMYICPGYITLWIHNSVIARRLKETNQMLLKSVVISYIYVIVADYINNITGFINNKKMIIAIISIVVGISIDKIVRSNIYNRVLCYFDITSTPHVDIIDRLIDEQGTWLRVYLDNQKIMYEGYLRYHRMDPEDEKDIALSGFVKYKILDKVIVADDNNQTELKIIEDNTCDNSKWIALKYELITRLEVIYNDKK